MTSLAEAFKRHIETELPNVWGLMPPNVKDAYSKAYRRGYAQGRKDMIEEWSTKDAERDEMVRGDTDRPGATEGQV